MSNALIALLENRGLIADGTPRDATISTLTKSEFVAIAEEAVAVSTVGKDDRGGSKDHVATTQAASIGLSGGRYPCAGLECRVGQARHLAQFTAFYSDRVLIHNPLAAWAEHKGSRYRTVGEARNEFHNDIAVLVEFAPLIAGGLAEVVSTPKNLCPHCFALSLANDSTAARYRSAAKALADRFADETEMRFDQKGRSMMLRVSGPIELIEHGRTNIGITRLPPALEKSATFRSKLKRLGTVKLTKRDVRASALDSYMSRKVFDTVSFEVAMAELVGARYLAERDLFVDVLTEITGDDETARRNRFVAEHLSALVPFLADVPATELLRLRRGDGDAFELFRERLNAVVGEYHKARGRLRKRDAEQLYGDVLRPGVIAVEKKLAVARNQVVGKVVRDVLGWGAVLSFGVWSGLVPATMIAAAKVLGVAAAKELATGALEAGSSKGQVESEPMYYLWKVRKQASGLAKPTKGDPWPK